MASQSGWPSRLVSKLRIIAMVGLAGLALGGAAPVRAAPPGSTSYRLILTVQGSSSIQPLVMVCTIDARCRGRIDLPIDGKPQRVTVIAVISPGQCIITFATATMPLFVGPQWYGYITFGISRRVRATVSVTEPTLEDLDDVATLLRRPVTRHPAVLATLDVEIRPDD